MPLTVIDTATTGLFDFKRPADAPGQPRLARLSMYRDALRSAADLQQSIVVELVKPDGWEMSTDAARASGIRTEDCIRNGLPIDDVLQHYIEVINAGHTIVAYNAAYHCKIMRAELRRAGYPDMIESTKTICLMRAAMQFQIPKANGKKGFPTMTDVTAFFSAQNARQDALTTPLARVVFILDQIERNGALPEATTAVRD